MFNEQINSKKKCFFLRFTQFKCNQPKCREERGGKRYRSIGGLWCLFSLSKNRIKVIPEKFFTFLFSISKTDSVFFLFFVFGIWFQFISFHYSICKFPHCVSNVNAWVYPVQYDFIGCNVLRRGRRIRENLCH